MCLWPELIKKNPTSGVRDEMGEFGGVLGLGTGDCILFCRLREAPTLSLGVLHR